MKVSTEFYKNNARKAVQKRKDNIFHGLHYKRKRKLIELLNDYRACLISLKDYDKDTIIAQEIMRTTMASFCRFGDRNHLTNGLILHYIRKDGVPLDVQAMDLTEQYAIKFTEEDFFQFMINNPNGRKSFSKYQDLELIKESIKSITKFNVTAGFVKYLKNKLEPKQDSCNPF